MGLLSTWSTSWNTKLGSEYKIFVFHALECIFRAANSHTLTMRLTHFTTFSRSHCDITISHTFFFFWGRKKKSVGVPPPPPPPAHHLFWDLRDFIGWQRTAPRISNSKLSSNVGSPASLEYKNMKWNTKFLYSYSRNTSGIQVEYNLEYNISIPFG